MRLAGETEGPENPQRPGPAPLAAGAAANYVVLPPSIGMTVPVT